MGRTEEQEAALRWARSEADQALHPLRLYRADQGRGAAAGGEDRRGAKRSGRGCEHKREPSAARARGRGQSGEPSGGATDLDEAELLGRSRGQWARGGGKSRGRVGAR